jgi:hypothetical protein
MVVPGLGRYASQSLRREMGGSMEEEVMEKSKGPAEAFREGGRGEGEVVVAVVDVVLVVVLVVVVVLSRR